jgi:hypothetical protein
MDSRIFNFDTRMCEYEPLARITPKSKPSTHGLESWTDHRTNPDIFL